MRDERYGSTSRHIAEDDLQEYFNDSNTLEFEVKTLFTASKEVEVTKINGHVYKVEGEGFGSFSVGDVACDVDGAWIKKPSEHKVTRSAYYVARRRGFPCRTTS